jgi:superfamily I DNA/RNA helicase
MTTYNCIYGPPGTGKTTEIVNRIKACIEHGISSDKIGLVSFTKAGAKELAHRAGINTRNTATIHSVAFKQAGIIKDQVMGREQLQEFSRASGIPISGANPEEADYLQDGDEYLALYQLSKARMDETFTKTYNESHRPGQLPQYLYFCESLDNFKQAYGYIDFNDMLTKALDFPAPDIDVLFIDEAQDLSPLQWQLINYWCDKVPGAVTIAGDDDQAIYVWGGADSAGMQKWEHKWQADRTILNKSYRIPAKVHALAGQIISRVDHRVEKEYWPREEDGQINFYGNESMLRFEPFEDCLVLYRNHSIREDLERQLIDLGIPYSVGSGKPGVMQSYTARAIYFWNRLQEDWIRMGNITLNSREMGMLKRNMYPVWKMKIDRNEIPEEKVPWQMVSPVIHHPWRKGSGS